MSTPPDQVQQLLANNPAFKQAMFRFMALYDAAEVLDELKPPNGGTAAAYLREVGRHVVREAGIPESFIEVIIAARPPVDPTPREAPDEAGDWRDDLLGRCEQDGTTLQVREIDRGNGDIYLEPFCPKCGVVPEL